MNTKWMISRRTMLRGAAGAIALPLLDAMVPGSVAQAASALPAAAGGAAGAARAAIPTRMAFVFIPNGVNVKEWFPQTGDDAEFELTPSLQPLKEVKDEITMIKGLTLDAARAHGDGPGDHARSAAAFLTGAHPYKTAGKDIRLGVSVDQVAAAKVGEHTRYPSLEIGLDKGQIAGNCDSGYSCAYVSNISWRSEASPMPKEIDPGAVFDRLFGPQDAASIESSLRRLKERKSVLDYVLDDSKKLNARLGKSDQHKLDEFTTSIREVEKRVERARQQNLTAPKPDVARPEGIPEKFADHMDLMYDMLALSFRMDVTRIGTYMIARDGSDRTFRELGISEGHHSLSHHGRDPQKLEAIRKIDLFHIERFARFVEKLKATPEGDGSLLDHTTIMLGSGICDGDRHNHNDLPILLAGRGGGTVKPGRNLKVPDNTPLCNLYVSMLEGMGIKTDRFGDSTGPLKGLA
ncbi:MAG: hypothetical protein JWO87_3004 [Phycisphaerales bacterium]|nr:hypothetical protein [Phycisphaerales bacterium]